MHQQKNIERNEQRKEGRKEGRERKGKERNGKERKGKEREGRKEGCEIEMRCCKTLHRCPTQRPLQLSKEDSLGPLGKLHDNPFFGRAKLYCGEALRPPPRPLPLFIVERFHFIHFIRSLTH